MFILKKTMSNGPFSPWWGPLWQKIGGKKKIFCITTHHDNQPNTDFEMKKNVFSSWKKLFQPLFQYWSLLNFDLT